MRLVGETKVGGEPRQAGFALGDPLQREAHSEPIAIAGDRLSGLGLEDPAQMMRRDRGLSRELDDARGRVLDQELARLGDDPPSRERGRRPPGLDALRRGVRKHRRRGRDHGIRHPTVVG